MNGDVVTLRPATVGDLDTVVGIWYSGASLPGIGPAALPPIEALRRRMDEDVAEGLELTVAERSGEVVGFIAMRLDQAVLDQLFVRPDCLGSGIGKMLFSHAEAMMPAGFSLFTRPGNVRAKRFYEALGMTVLRHDIHPRFGDPIVFYRWTPA